MVVPTGYEQLYRYRVSEQLLSDRGEVREGQGYGARACGLLPDGVDVRRDDIGLRIGEHSLRVRDRGRVLHPRLCVSRGRLYVLHFLSPLPILLGPVVGTAMKAILANQTLLLIKASPARRPLQPSHPLRQQSSQHQHPQPSS